MGFLLDIVRDGRRHGPAFLGNVPEATNIGALPGNGLTGTDRQQPDRPVEPLPQHPSRSVEPPPGLELEIDHPPADPIEESSLTERRGHTTVAGTEGGDTAPAEEKVESPAGIPQQAEAGGMSVPVKFATISQTAAPAPSEGQRGPVTNAAPGREPNALYSKGGGARSPRDAQPRETEGSGSAKEIGDIDLVLEPRQPALDLIEVTLVHRVLIASKELLARV